MVLLDFDAVLGQLLAPGVELDLADRERGVYRAGRPVRRHHPAGLGRERRVEEEQHAGVVEPEDALLDLA